jgi:uncharacterized membrane protein (DUF485 family)
MGKPKSVSPVATISVIAAVTLIAALGWTWYEWTLSVPSAHAVLGSGGVDAWHAWSVFDWAVTVLASVAALLMVVGAGAHKPRLFTLAIILAVLVVAGVVYMMVDPYQTPHLSAQEAESVTLQGGAWIGLAAALALLLTAVYAARAARRTPATALSARHSVLPLALLLVGSLVGAGGVVAHVVDDQHPFYDSGGPQSDTKCAEGLARVAHGNYDHGFTRSNTFALTSLYVYPPACKRLQDGRPNGTISTRFVYQVRNGGDWGGCDSSNLQKNADGDATVEAYRNYANYPCGGGHYYRTHGFFGYLDGQTGNWVNSDWMSGDHWWN